ncbi:hypothetical protein B0H19DRAFT_1080126 [Mycena capillaripes]|nr:hypothetical protein B0H19DRAFT_1080126 [Mycena capillaripes]
MGGDVTKRRFPLAAIIPINSAAAPASIARSGCENRHKFAKKKSVDGHCAEVHHSSGLRAGGCQRRDMTNDLLSLSLSHNPDVSRCIQCTSGLMLWIPNRQARATEKSTMKTTLRVTTWTPVSAPTATRSTQ